MTSSQTALILGLALAACSSDELPSRASLPAGVGAPMGPSPNGEPAPSAPASVTHNAPAASTTNARPEGGPELPAGPTVLPATPATTDTAADDGLTPPSGEEPMPSAGEPTAPNASTGASPAAAPADAGTSVDGPPQYALPPPSQCHNQDYIDFQEGCIEGDETSLCGGACNTINACLESKAEKPHADVTFVCPRTMLFSDEMLQAAADDGNDAFHYAIVGHDADIGGIDGQDQSTCCQCYQLVFAHPSPQLDRQVLMNPDDVADPESAIAVPPPLIVQSFNTAATIHSFDVYMAAGGLGANNGCAPVAQTQSRSGEYLYTSYPEVGQPGNGGVKPVTHASACKNELQWVTQESLSSVECQRWVEAQCNQLESNVPGLTEQARASCVRANSPNENYHLNWSVYAMKVECPLHLTQVTGCRLAPRGLPQVAREVTTAAVAASDPGFFSRSTAGEMYHTTTMEDCCRPSCASKDWIEGRGLRPDGQYNAFYSCDSDGRPFTEPE